MNNLTLKIITPRKVVWEQEVQSVTVPGADGELTILPEHTYLLSLLKEGIITMRYNGKEESLAIGGGYVETDGKETNILVSRAYRQDEIDQELTQKALANAQKILEETKDEKVRQEALATIRRSTLDLKFIRRRRKV